MAANCIMDKFLFLFICAEILCNDSGVKVERPYTNPSCQHKIENCPECGRSTRKKIFGPTLKKYLVQELGLLDQTSKDIWKVRQFIHGEGDINSDLLNKISDICLLLESGIAYGIKGKLSMSADKLPIVESSGPGISGFIALGTRRAITKDDL